MRWPEKWVSDEAHNPDELTPVSDLGEWPLTPLQFQEQGFKAAPEIQGPFVF
ncbi:hypothetical protein [Yersinia alsatica]|uniref:hypothetical protein n=1 Tax=Yersinia alsatica TaxID=2890317 RepID=UPI0016438A33|nr:hypothetical protein [Yersinia alsatica]